MPLPSLMVRFSSARFVWIGVRCLIRLSLPLSVRQTKACWTFEAIPLRPKEFEVLLYLVQRPGMVITRDDLMNVVWGFDYISGQRMCMLARCARS